MQPATQRYVIHADDVGMCHGTNVAFVELFRHGTISACSVMVPCPWFSEIAAIAAADQALDVGVHLTLTSEQQYYRWAPVTRQPASAGLTDDAGFMWPTVAQVQANAHPDAVEEEWRGQIDRALAAGIDVTHLDAHMGAALAPEWCDRYVRMGIEYDVPVLLTSTWKGYEPGPHVKGTDEDVFRSPVEIARAAGMPLFGWVLETDFGRSADQPVDYEGKLHSTDRELVYCAFHPCRPGPGEVEAIEPGSNHVRTDEYALFRTDSWKQWLDAQPFEVVGMRTLRDDWRASRA